MTLLNQTSQQDGEYATGVRAAPIALFVYNRPGHTRRTVEALQRNELAAESDLFVFCDGARDAAASAEVREVRAVVRTIAGFKSLVIVEHDRNVGLAKSIIGGVTRVCRDHNRVIVVEDDLETSPHFLRFMNDALHTYENDAAVGSVHGYWYPVDCSMPETFFLRGASCWGWATWLRAWRLFEPDGLRLLSELERRGLTSLFDLEGAVAYTQMLKDQIAGVNHSWAIRWHAAMFLAGSLQLSPTLSLVRNIGFDGTGTHCAETDAYAVELATRPIAVQRIPFEECGAARSALKRYYRSTRRSLPTRVLGRVRRLMGV